MTGVNRISVEYRPRSARWFGMSEVDPFNPPRPSGPRRRAPRYYIGEHVGEWRTVPPDIERYENGSLPGKRDKAARRVIRAAFVKSKSRVERAVRRTRALKAQAVETARDGGRTKPAQRRFAQRLFAAELAIHQTVYVPDKKTRRTMRTRARKDKRAGKPDAIGALVDRMQKK